MLALDLLQRVILSKPSRPASRRLSALDLVVTSRIGSPRARWCGTLPRRMFDRQSTVERSQASRFRVACRRSFATSLSTQQQMLAQPLCVESRRNKPCSRALGVMHGRLSRVNCGPSLTTSAIWPRPALVLTRTLKTRNSRLLPKLQSTGL